MGNEPLLVVLLVCVTHVIAQGGGGYFGRLGGGRARLHTLPLTSTHSRGSSSSLRGHRSSAALTDFRYPVGLTGYTSSASVTGLRSPVGFAGQRSSATLTDFSSPVGLTGHRTSATLAGLGSSRHLAGLGSPSHSSDLGFSTFGASASRFPGSHLGRTVGHGRFGLGRRGELSRLSPEVYRRLAAAARAVIGTTVLGRPITPADPHFRLHGGAGAGQAHANGLSSDGWDGNPATLGQRDDGWTSSLRPNFPFSTFTGDFSNYQQYMI